MTTRSQTTNTKNRGNGCTLKEVGKAVSLSPSTVSRILNGKASAFRIADETVERVTKTAKAMGFRPNYIASVLNTDQTLNIGLIFANRIDEFLGGIMEGVENSLRETEYQMVVATCENNPEVEQREIERMFYRRMDGIIIYPSASHENQNPTAEHLASPSDKTIPVVVIGRRLPLQADHVLFSDYLAGQNTALEFIRKNAKKFAALTLAMDCSANADRVLGFVETLRMNGIPENNIKVLVHSDDKLIENSLKLTDCDAIWAVNSSLLMTYTGELAKTRDISHMPLASIGKIPFRDQLPFNVETFDTPTHEMGETAVQHLLERIANPEPPPRTVRLPWPT